MFRLFLFLSQLSLTSTWILAGFPHQQMTMIKHYYTSLQNGFARTPVTFQPFLNKCCIHEQKRFCLHEGNLLKCTQFLILKKGLNFVNSQKKKNGYEY